MTVRPYTILIIDDCLEDRRLYSRYLTKDLLSDYKIVEAESGEEGLEQLVLVKPDLILLDYLLPDFTGLEFIEELKAQENQVPPIIMLTGQGNEIIAVEAMKSGVKDYLVKGKLTPEILTTSIKYVLQQHHLQSLLTKNLHQQQLIAQTALNIRQSLDLSEILHTAVREVQLLLNCDRVVIYQFAPDLTGDIVAESVNPGWTKSLGAKIVDTCFQDRSVIHYEKGKTLAVDNIYLEEFSQCHLQLLEKFQVKANIVVPILLAPSPAQSQNSRLWGLLIAHQCSHFRHWETDEVELLDKLAVQLAIAIQQAELFKNLQKELDNRKKLEIELARRVEVLEASDDYIGLADVEGRVIWNNPRMKEIMGMEEGTDGAKLSIADYHPHWALKIVKTQGIPTAIRKGSWLGESALLTKDNQEIPVSQLIIAHKSPEGKVKYISTVMRDLTKQKETEKSLQERAKELEWLNQELVKITSLLKKRNQELDRFAYVTSHDLKAPLRAIANLATWLSEDLEGQIPEENQQQLKLMQSRVKRMDNLIQGLLEYSRVGRKNTPVQTINVGNLVHEVIDSLLPPPNFEIMVADPMPTLQTEAILLQQVFSNLISNAIKYHPNDSGKITISVKEQEKFYEFGVSDDGMGIEPQYHTRIFAIFQTLQPRDTIESTGIGLSIVKKIVEGQGGKIWVESQLGEGATFYFTWKK
ncbi:MAG: ATP-binding protein [Xenococcaceae cyanobacterium MO_188.B19]|nr:ATP-binding protein [Xenococcaceae cyanobacterium MO_188.B19]